VKHTPEDHALIRVLGPDVARIGEARRHRPPAIYGCSCRLVLPGDSRRQARPAHKAHRREVKA
jgi:hypothetical protein